MIDSDRYKFILAYHIIMLHRCTEEGWPSQRETRPVPMSSSGGGIHCYVFCRRRDSLLCLLQEEGFTAMSSSRRGIQRRLPMPNAVLCRLYVRLPIEDVFTIYMSFQVCLCVIRRYHELCIYGYLVHQLLSMFYMDKSFYLCGYEFS